MDVSASSTASRRDIEDRTDIEHLVRTFYERAFADPLLGPVFVDIAKLDLDAHLPVMCDFWQAVILHIPGYRGGAFALHVDLHHMIPLTPEMFGRWLELWWGTLDDFHEGPHTEIARGHAQRVASAFSLRLSQIPSTAVGRA